MIILKRVVKLIHIRHSASAFCDKIRPYRKNTCHISCHKIGNILPFSHFIQYLYRAFYNFRADTIPFQEPDFIVFHHSITPVRMDFTSPPA